MNIKSWSRDCVLSEIADTSYNIGVLRECIDNSHVAPKGAEIKIPMSFFEQLSREDLNYFAALLFDYDTNLCAFVDGELGGAE